MLSPAISVDSTLRHNSFARRQLDRCGLRNGRVVGGRLLFCSNSYTDLWRTSELPACHPDPVDPAFHFATLSPADNLSAAGYATIEESEGDEHPFSFRKFAPTCRKGTIIGRGPLSQSNIRFRRASPQSLVQRTMNGSNGLGVRCLPNVSRRGRPALSNCP